MLGPEIQFKGPTAWRIYTLTSVPMRAARVCSAERLTTMPTLRKGVDECLQTLKDNVREGLRMQDKRTSRRMTHPVLPVQEL